MDCFQHFRFERSSGFGPWVHIRRTVSLLPGNQICIHCEQDHLLVQGTENAACAKHHRGFRRRQRRVCTGNSIPERKTQMEMGMLQLTTSRITSDLFTLKCQLEAYWRTKNLNKLAITSENHCLTFSSGFVFSPVPQNK